MASRKLISVVMPAYNEEACIAALYERLAAVSAGLPQYDFEFILVENGSEDNSYRIAAGIHERDRRFKVIRLSRNFMPEGGIAAGLAAASGDAAVIMSADLEDPPELIPQFLQKWEEGYDNVYGIIEKRHASALRRFNARLFYHLVHRLSGRLVPKDVADFRLVDRKVYGIINQMPERSRFLRGLFAWSGFPATGIPFTRGIRHGGRSKASTGVVMDLAFKGICGFSYMPLRLPMLLGLVLSLPAFAGLVYCIGRMLVSGWLPFTAFWMMLCMNLFLFGVLFIILGIMGEYIGMVSREVKGRPLFIIDKQLGLD